jgi:hypothetical protein
MAVTVINHYSMAVTVINFDLVVVLTATDRHKQTNKHYTFNVLGCPKSSETFYMNLYLKFFLKTTLNGVILCGQSIARIPEA